MPSIKVLKYLIHKQIQTLFWYIVTGVYRCTLCLVPFLSDEKYTIKMTSKSEFKNMFVRYTPNRTFTNRVETPFSCRKRSTLTFDDSTLRSVEQFKTSPFTQNVAQREIPLLTIIITHPAVAKHVNRALRHVIRSSVCKHASKACDSADVILRSKAQLIRKRGCVSWAGPRCGAVENSMCSATRRFITEKWSWSRYHPSLDRIRDRITQRRVCSG